MYYESSTGISSYLLLSEPRVTAVTTNPWLRAINIPNATFWVSGVVFWGITIFITITSTRQVTSIALPWVLDLSLHSMLKSHGNDTYMSMLCLEILLPALSCKIQYRLQEIWPLFWKSCIHFVLSFSRLSWSTCCRWHSVEYGHLSKWSVQFGVQDFGTLNL